MNSEGYLESRLFFKPIHSGTVCHWSSNGPRSTKESLVYEELRRAVKRSTNEENKNYSIRISLERFKQNGYPTKILNKICRRFQRNSTQPATVRQTTSQPVYIKCPYIDESTKRKFQSSLRRTGLQENVKLWHDPGQSLKKIFRPPKEKIECSTDCITCKTTDKKNQCTTKFVIYEITCDLCQKTYVGETKRMVGQRITEHINGINFSAVKEHFKEFHNSVISQFKWRILHKNLRNDGKRRNVEAQYIRRGENTMNLSSNNS